MSIRSMHENPNKFNLSYVRSFGSKLLRPTNQNQVNKSIKPKIKLVRFFGLLSVSKTSLITPDFDKYKMGNSKIHIRSNNKILS